MTLEEQIKEKIYAKDLDGTNRLMVRCALRGEGTEAEYWLTKIVGELEDHDLRHYWLEDRCDCGR